MKKIEIKKRICSEVTVNSPGCCEITPEEEKERWEIKATSMPGS